MTDYADYSVTPLPERTVWDDVAWFDGPTLLGFDYGDAPADDGGDQ